MSSFAPFLLLYSLIFVSFVFLSHATLKVLDLENPALDVTPSRLHVFSHDVSINIFFRERVKVSVTLAPSTAIPERLHSKIQVCFHQTVMSPYEERYVDVNFIGDTSRSVSIAVYEGLIPLNTSMDIGVFLVIIIHLFSDTLIMFSFTVMIQGMKLLPTGKKNVFHLSMYGSLGANTFVLHQISMLMKCSRAIPIMNTISSCKHSHIDTIYMFVLVGIVLARAGLRYWMVRKFIISKDGSMDDRVAQLVYWAMHIIASIDTPLALVALVFSCAIYFLILKWWYIMYHLKVRKSRARVSKTN
ncbi:DUF2215 domain-containing protein [Salix suchowensis]|nr:DUF2215 domain-containing protein [Salix suchowensis]